MINYGLISVIVLIGIIILFIIKYERNRKSIKEIVLISSLAAIAGGSRIPFAAIPNVQPTTFLVIVSGFVFGPSFGFAVGVIATLVSNSFLGHGPWTPWQMIAWGLAGFTAGLFSGNKLFENRLVLALFAFLWGFLFDYIMNLWHWLFFIYPLNIQTFIAVYLASFYFDLLHAIGNFVFTYFFAKDLIIILSRFKEKLSYSVIEKEEL
jgi:energy-coupling factor transport system substrate-specific component